MPRHALLPLLLLVSALGVRSPDDEVRWREDLNAARAEALAGGRPLFVVMRCLPCKQCSEFDQDVLEGGPELGPLLEQFVTVRLTDAADVDLELFPMEDFQDLDLSWWGWFLSPAGDLYGVYGGRDHVSDKTRISVTGLASTLQRVLDHHRTSWTGDGTAKRSARPRGLTPRELPGYASWAAKVPTAEKSECIHCHQVADILRQPAVDAGSFDKETGFEVWPFPENVGFALERDHGLRVGEVTAGGPAAAIGLQAGDVLRSSGERLLFSEADFRGVLHRAPRTETRIPLSWQRDDTELKGELIVSEGWKRTILDWRMSVSQGNVGAYPSFWPNGARQKDRDSLGLAGDTMAIRPWFGPNPSGPAWTAGLRGGHIIVAVGGENPELHGRAFLVWFRKRYDEGDSVTLSVVGGDGSTRDITYEL